MKTITVNELKSLARALSSKYGCPSDFMTLTTLVKMCPDKLHPAVVSYWKEVMDREVR